MEIPQFGAEAGEDPFAKVNLFKRQPSLRQRKRNEFEDEFRRKVLSRVFSISKEEQWRDLQKWIRTVAQGGRTKARELRRMIDEDRHSRSRQVWDQIRERQPNSFSVSEWAQKR